MDSAHIKGITDFPYMLVLGVIKSIIHDQDNFGHLCLYIDSMCTGHE